MPREIHGVYHFFFNAAFFCNLPDFPLPVPPFVDLGGLLLRDLGLGGIKSSSPSPSMSSNASPAPASSAAAAAVAVPAPPLPPESSAAFVDVLPAPVLEVAFGS